MKQASDGMYEMALGMGMGKIKHVYSVQKLKKSINNDELRKVLRTIFEKGADGWTVENKFQPYSWTKVIV